MFPFCCMLSLGVLCCLIFFNANYHELSINFGAQKFMDNYMVIICSFLLLYFPYVAIKSNVLTPKLLNSLTPL